MKTLTAFLCLLLTASCSTQQYIKPTVIPEIVINYECQIDQADKDSLTTAILNAVSCDIPVTITITEYYKASTLSAMFGWPLKADTIKGAVHHNGKTDYITSELVFRGLIIPFRDIKDVEKAFAKDVWEIVCRIYKKGTSQNTP